MVNVNPDSKSVILKLLRNSSGFISGEVIAESMSVSRGCRMEDDQ